MSKGNLASKVYGVWEETQVFVFLLFGMGFPQVAQTGKNLLAAQDLGLIFRLGRTLEKGWQPVLD